MKRTLNRTGIFASRSLQKMVRWVGAWGWTRPSRTVWEGTRWLIVELDREEKEDWIPSHPFIFPSISQYFMRSLFFLFRFPFSFPLNQLNRNLPLKWNQNLRRRRSSDWCSFQRWTWNQERFNPPFFVLPVLPLPFLFSTFISPFEPAFVLVISCAKFHPRRAKFPRWRELWVILFSMLGKYIDYDHTRLEKIYLSQRRG